MYNDLEGGSLVTQSKGLGFVAGIFNFGGFSVNYWERARV